MRYVCVCVCIMWDVCDDKTRQHTQHHLHKKPFFESQVEIQKKSLENLSWISHLHFQKNNQEREMGDPWDMIMKGGTSGGDGLKAEIRSLIITPRKWMNESKKT